MKAALAPPRFAKGADVGWLTEMEDSGRAFYNASGQKKDLLAILKEQGLDAIRLRVWVNPAHRYNGVADVLAKSLRVKKAGMRLMIDFHYSDDWADPGKQYKPKAWENFTPAQLKGAVYQHTYAVLDTLKAHGIDVEWVQVGNEVTHGMLWPEGRADLHIGDFAQMVDTGYAAVKAVYPKSKVIVHVDNGWDDALYRFLFDGLARYKTRYDIIGMSLYPRAGHSKPFTDSCLATCRDVIARYGVPVMLVEVGMPADQPAECRAYIANLIKRLKALPNHMGQGVFYWEPQGYDKHYPLHAWQYNGRPSDAMRGFSDE